jgi:hypothetical protein
MLNTYKLNSQLAILHSNYYTLHICSVSQISACWQTQCMCMHTYRRARVIFEGYIFHGYTACTETMLNSDWAIRSVRWDSVDVPWDPNMANPLSILDLHDNHCDIVWLKTNYNYASEIVNTRKLLTANIYQCNKIQGSYLVTHLEAPSLSRVSFPSRTRTSAQHYCLTGYLQYIFLPLST